MGKMQTLFELNNQIIDLSSQILRIFRLPKEIASKKIRNENINLKRYKKSDRCYVVGLGPSLKDVNFDKLDGDIIVTNRFHRFDSDAKILPTYYCVVDGAFYCGEAEGDFNEILKAYSDTCLVANGKFRKIVEEKRNNNCKIKNIFYAYMWRGSFTHKKKLDFTKILPLAQNVVHVGIMLAMYCGYKEIILLGCDFNSFASPVANHCYTDEKSDRLWSLDYELYCYAVAARTHVELYKYAEKQGIKIYNVTKGSLLDAYPFNKEMMELIYST